MGSLSVILAYIAPEVVLPVASALAGAVGFVLMVGRAPIRFAARIFRRVTGGVRTTARGSHSRGDRPSQAS